MTLPSVSAKADSLLKRPALMTYRSARTRLLNRSPAHLWVETKPEPKTVHAVLVALMYGRPYNRRRPGPLASEREHYWWEARKTAIAVLHGYDRLSGDHLADVIGQGISQQLWFPNEWLADPRLPVALPRRIVFGEPRDDIQTVYRAGEAIKHPGLCESLTAEQWRSLLTRGPHLASPAVKSLAGDLTGDDVTTVLSRSDGSRFLDLLYGLAFHSFTDVHWSMISDPAGHPSVARMAAANPKTPLPVLEQLAFHPDITTRTNLTENPASPEHVRVAAALLGVEQRSRGRRP